MRTPSRTGSRALAVVVLLLLTVGGVQAQDLQDTVQAGWKALQAGELVEARAAFQSVLDAAPNYDFGWYALGQVASKEANYDEAIENFKKAIELKGDKFEYAYGLAAVFRTKREYAKAVATLNNAEQYAADRQNRYLLHFERGSSYQALKQHDRAAADLEKAVEIQPGEFYAEQRLGISLTNLHEYGRAAEHLKKAAAKNATDYNTQFYLARALLNVAQAETDKAAKISHYTDAVRAAQAANTARQGFDAENALARAYLGAGQSAKAIPAFQAALESKPGYCPARVNLGQAYLAQEAWGPAADNLALASQCDPSNTLVLNRLALAYTKLERREEALVVYEKSYEIKADPQIADDMNRLKQNIDIAAENILTDEFNAEQLAALEKDKAELARQQAEYEAEQERIRKYKDVTEDN